MMSKNEIEMNSEIGKYWSNAKEEPRTRWWQSEEIIRHCNYRICGEKVDGWNAGGYRILGQKLNNKVLKSAISIGCGEAEKEMDFIEQGLVEHFDCFELAEDRIKRGKLIAEKRGLSTNIDFYLSNPIQNDIQDASYDFVFWDNSLHHMLSAYDAIQMSYRILRPGGWFYCNDYCGKSRFQWSDLELAIMNGVRASLAEDIFIRDENRNWSRTVYRPDIEKMMEIDYSEAADSENIIPAFKEIFKKELVIKIIGGMIFHTTMNNILSNIEDDSDIMQKLLAMDEDCAEHGIFQYAFLMAEK